MDKIIINECSSCYFFEPISDKHLEIKGFCRRETILPDPVSRYDSCENFQKDNPDEPNL